MSRSQDPLIGTSPGGYLVRSCLSHGALFNIYVARQSSVDRTVVLKILSPHARAGQQVTAAFLDGARLAAKLNHRNIVQVFDVVETNGLTFVSMEHVSGRSLEEHVRRNGNAPQDLWPKLIVDSCTAISYAQEAGILHTELTPSNVLVTDDGDVKILNLGIAAAIEPFRSPLKRRDPYIVSFLAPERLAGHASDHRADVYSLGGTLYFATTGRPPYRADSVAELIVARRSRDVRSLSQLDSTAPEGISLLLARFMAPDPEDRPAGPREALAEARRSTDPGSLWRRHGLKLAAAAATLVVLAIIAIASGRLSPTVEEGSSGDETATSTETSTRTEPGTRRVDEELLDKIAAAATRTPARQPETKDASGSPSSISTSTEAAKADPADDAAGMDLRIALDEAVHPSIEIGGYRRALDYIDGLRKEHPNAKLLDKAAARALRAAEVEIATTRKVVETASSVEAIAELLESLNSLETRVPEDLVGQVRRISQAAAARRDTATSDEKQLEDAETTVLFILGDHDLDAAREVVARLPQNPLTAPHPGRERVAKRIERYQLAWKLLLAGLETAKADTSVRLIAPPLDPPEESIFRSIVRVGPAEKGRVVVTLRENANSDPEECRMLDLHPVSLLMLLRLGGADEHPEAVEGLGTVLFSRRGPLAALRFVDILPLEEDSRKSTSEHVRDLGRRLLTRSAENLGSLADLEAEDDDAKDASQIALRDAVDELIARHGALPYYKQHRATLRELRMRAVESIYTRRGVASLFHGDFREGKGGLVRIDYDFSSAEALKDFVVLNGEMRHDSKSLLLAGECRLLHGNPFRTRMRITAHAARYTPTSPNLNIAVWTRPEDEVTSQPTITETDAQKEQEKADKAKYGPTENGTDLPNDYVAFCVGYRLSGETLNQVGEAKAVATMPAFAIVAGIRGITLHRGHGSGTYYTYWAESVGNRLKGGQKIMLDLEPDSFRWSTGAFPLHTALRKRRPDAMSWLRRTPTIGSVTLFTNGSEVRYSRLRVEAELAPSWVAAERTRLALIEFDAVERLHGVVKE